MTSPLCLLIVHYLLVFLCGWNFVYQESLLNADFQVFQDFQLIQWSFRSSLFLSTQIGTYFRYFQTRKTISLKFEILVLLSFSLTDWSVTLIIKLFSNIEISTKYGAIFFWNQARKQEFKLEIRSNMYIFEKVGMLETGMGWCFRRLTSAKF